MSLEYRYGHWSIIYRPNGRNGRKVRQPIDKSIQDPIEAKAIHDEVINAKKASISRELNPRPLTGLTVGKLWDEYLPYAKMYKAATTYKDLSNIKKYVKEYIGAYGAEDLSNAHIEIYKRLRSEKRKAKHEIPRALNKETDYIRGFIRWAGREGHITKRKIEVNKLNYERPIPQILSVEEVGRILEAAEPFYQAFFLCLYSLGLRAAEAKRLKWDDIDTENMTVQVKQKGGTFKILPMGERLQEALKGVGEPQPGQNIFMSRRKGKRYKDKAIVDVRSAIERAKTKAKITKRITPHLFRHSISCHLMSENVNASMIQKLLGHRNITTTQWYSHVSMANLKGVETVISGFLKKRDAGTQAE